MAETNGTEMVAKEIPVVVLVGRPNVGKSSLFNAITGTRKALIDNTPGVTRDPITHRVNHDDRIFDLVDLGGFGGQDVLQESIENVGRKWIERGDLILLTVDGKEGLTPVDMELIDLMRKLGKKFILVVNKFDNPSREDLLIDFYSTGVDRLFPVSALHKRGIEEIKEEIVRLTDPPHFPTTEIEEHSIKLALIGRPNVGKSSLANAIIREDKLITSEVPGTTRDTIDINFIWKGKPFTIIDTPGIRRKSRIDTRVERKSSVRSIDTMERADISLLVIDSVEGITTQDLKLFSLTERRGRAVILVFNKMDLIEEPDKFEKEVLKYINFKYPFLRHIPKVFVSARTGYGIGNLHRKVIETYKQFDKRVTTGQLNRFFKEVIEHHSHPLGKGFRPVKFYYITQIETRPPTFVLFTNKPEEVSENYLKYVKNKIKEQFDFYGVPIKILLKERGNRT